MTAETGCGWRPVLSVVEENASSATTGWPPESHLIVVKMSANKAEMSYMYTSSENDAGITRKKVDTKIIIITDLTLLRLWLVGIPATDSVERLWLSLPHNAQRRVVLPLFISWPVAMWGPAIVMVRVVCLSVCHRSISSANSVAGRKWAPTCGMLSSIVQDGGRRPFLIS